MEDQLFAIIDVETTGGGITGNRITEICVVLLKGNSIIDKYTTLVNPDKLIPYSITALTGIDNEMVASAPYFYEVADTINQLTENAVFVAHNVTFDYNVIRNEFKAIGINYSRKKLCTVRLSRRLIPGLASYSLGNLCSSISIPLNDRHRAEGDTDATVILFKRLLGLDDDFSLMLSFLNNRSKQGILPPHLSRDQIDNLPETPGIYLFKDKQHKVIYAGMSKNIKKRVLSHIYSKSTKEFQLSQETYYIDFEETGNELIALLLESDLIKKHFPKHNRAQKRPAYAYQIISYENRKNILQLALAKTKVVDDSIVTFYNMELAKERLVQLCEVFRLCPIYCGLQSSMEKCSHYRIKNCEGVCDGSEQTEAYNEKVRLAINTLEKEKPSYIIMCKGREWEEQAFVLVIKGHYQGYGYIDSDTSISSFEDCQAYLQPKIHSYHTNKIIESYLRTSNEKGVRHFKGLEAVEI
jgi:DNA polymerase-3 subunit epsilon